MKNRLVVLSTGAVLAMGSAGAQTLDLGEASANIAFTSDYRFRGISQTDRDFALQGGFDYAFDQGFYIGTWASNVDNFSSSPIDGTSGSQAEVDLYAGYGAALTDRVSADFNVLYFYYPGASTAGNQAEIDYVEFTPGISYSGDKLSSSFSISYSPDYFAESGTSFYFNSSASYPLNEVLSLGAHLGYQTIEDNPRFGTPDYADWSVSVSTSLVGLDWQLAYVDTDLDSRECFGGSDLCDAAAVATVSKSF